MDLATALGFARERNRGVLVTVKRDTRPQLSNILYVPGDGDTVRISITADRAKYHNLAREPWCALHITTDDFWQYAVLEGTATLTEPAASPDDATVAELVDYYRAASGEHENWDEYRATMVAERRVIAHVRAERAYGALRA